MAKLCRFKAKQSIRANAVKPSEIKRLNWKVIYVNSRSEKKVGERLEQEGIEYYLPLKKEVKQWSDRKKIVENPLIKGYVFVKPNAIQRDRVLQISGVLQYVRYNAGDAIIRDIEIEALRSVETKGYYIEGRFTDEWKTGDLVQIQHGPFKGLYGLVKTQGKERIYTIAIEGIGYALTVKVPGEVLAEK